MVAVVLVRKGQVLLARRVEGGLFGGLWEPPMVEAASLAEARGALAEVGVGASVKLTELGQVKHVLTHKELRVRVASGSFSMRENMVGTSWLWLTLYLGISARYCSGSKCL